MSYFYCPGGASRHARLFFGLLCVPVALFVLVAPVIAAGTAGDALPEKNGTVAIYVDDRTGAHVAAGSGFVADSRGLIATSCRLISKWIEKVENSISVELDGGARYPMEHVISNNCANNLVMIKIKADSLPAISVASSFNPRTGEQVRIQSSLSAVVKSVTAGEIKTVRPADNIFQLSRSVSAEYDGSAVLNSKGEVVGMVTFPGRGKGQHMVIPAKYIMKELAKCRHMIGLSPETAPLPVRSVPSPPVPVSVLPRPEQPIKPQETKIRSSAEQEFRRAYSYEKTGMYQEAVEAYRHALALRPDYMEAYVNLGLIYYKLERYSEAIDAYKLALKIKPGSSSVYNKLAAAYIITGEYASALESFKESLGLDPGNPETHFNLGVAYLIAGDRDGAINEYFVLKDLNSVLAEKLLDLIF